MNALKTHVYIDGFNLYYGLLKGTAFKWLDLEKFCDQTLSKNKIEKIYYFTARIEARPSDPDQPNRQRAYLEALSTLPRVEIHYGSFMSSIVNQVTVETDSITGKPKRLNGTPKIKTDALGNPVKVSVLKTEEKGSDVNLATYLLRDSYKKHCDCAVIISNDSDLIKPIEMAKYDCGIIIGLIPPRPKGSIELKRLANFKIDPRTNVLASSLLADPVITQNGSVAKPVRW